MLRKILISLFFVSAIVVGFVSLAKTPKGEPIVEQKALQVIPATVTPPSPPVIEEQSTPKTLTQKTASPAVVESSVQEETVTPEPEPKRTIRTSTRRESTRGAKTSADTTSTPVGNDSIFATMGNI